MSKTALITGISGQDGSYLAELLLSKGYTVHGLVRRSSSHRLTNIEHILDRITLHYGDLETEHHVCDLIHDLQPDELYNLAAQSDVGISFQCPEYTGDVTGLGVTRLLEAVRTFSPRTRVYQASTSELFGNAPPPQCEATPMIPVSPYAAAKLYAHHMAGIYRQAYGLYVSCGILFNHESPRRGPNFVTRKITMAAANILAGRQSVLELGNLDAKRDWGYAPDYVEAMWLMLQQERPDDFVIGTGEAHTVLDFVVAAFDMVGLAWKKYVRVNPQFVRPVDVNYLCADIGKAKSFLGWQPRTSLGELVRIMVEADVRQVGLEEEAV